MVLLLFTTSVVCARAAGPPVVLVRHRIRAILWWDRTLLALTYPQLGRAQELPATDPAAGGARPSAPRPRACRGRPPSAPWRGYARAACSRSSRCADPLRPAVPRPAVPRPPRRHRRRRPG